MRDPDPELFLKEEEEEGVPDVASCALPQVLPSLDRLTFPEHFMDTQPESDQICDGRVLRSSREPIAHTESIGFINDVVTTSVICNPTKKSNIEDLELKPLEIHTVNYRSITNVPSSQSTQKKLNETSFCQSKKVDNHVSNQSSTSHEARLTEDFTSNVKDRASTGKLSSHRPDYFQPSHFLSPDNPQQSSQPLSANFELSPSLPLQFPPDNYPVTTDKVQFYQQPMYFPPRSSLDSSSNYSINSSLGASKGIHSAVLSVNDYNDGVLTYDAIRSSTSGNPDDELGALHMDDPERFHLSGGSVSGGPVYPCEECPKVFRHPRSYYQHQHVHRGTHSCPDCGKLFSRRWDLMRHIKKTKFGCPAKIAVSK